MPTGQTRTTEEIRQIIDDMGYELIDIYFKNSDKKRRRVIFKDEIGYRYDVDLYNLMFHNEERRFVHRYNPYTLENIALWLEINEKPFELLSDNMYENEKSMLWLHCFNCNDDFKINWIALSTGYGCGVCSGMQIGKYNSLKYLMPEIAREWIRSENNLSPNDVTIGSSENVLWKCKTCHYEWENTVYARYRRNGCPSCCGYILSDKNRLSIIRPDIASEWHPTKNGDLTPDDVRYGESSRKFWWICSVCKYEWQDTPNHRTSNNEPHCSACSGHVVSDKNRLSILYPQLLCEWNYDKNTDIKPNNVSFGSKKKVWWICSKCEYEWITTIDARTNGHGCPKCNESRGEREIRRILNKYNILFYPQYKIAECKNVRPLPFDFYLPDYGILIEFHGKQHYSPFDFSTNSNSENAKKEFERIKKSDGIKEKFCENNNIPLLIIPHWEFDNIETILTEVLNL